MIYCPCHSSRGYSRPGLNWPLCLLCDEQDSLLLAPPGKPQSYDLTLINCICGTSLMVQVVLGILLAMRIKRFTHGWGPRSHIILQKEPCLQSCRPRALGQSSQLESSAVPHEAAVTPHFFTSRPRQPINTLIKKKASFQLRGTRFYFVYRAKILCFLTSS